MHLTDGIINPRVTLRRLIEGDLTHSILLYFTLFELTNCHDF
jgi:hypothetical protein